MNWISRSICVIAFLGLVLTGTVSRGQTFAEFFQQKKTQKKYLLQQIAALEIYGGYLKKGYQIVDGGLQTIRDMTDGEFKLHDAFISSLKQVSPAIKDDLRIAEIISLQIAMLKAYGGIKGSDLLSAENQAYIGWVAEGIIRECYADLEELLLVITAGKLEMKDQERLARLDSIYERMLDKMAFTQDFMGNTTLLIRQRAAEQKDLEGVIRMFHFKE